MNKLERIMHSSTLGVWLMQSLCRVNVYFFFAHIPGLCEVHFFLSHVYFFMRRGKDALLWQLGGGAGGICLFVFWEKILRLSSAWDSLVFFSSSHLGLTVIMPSRYLVVIGWKLEVLICNFFKCSALTHFNCLWGSQRIILLKAHHNCVSQWAGWLRRRKSLPSAHVTFLRTSSGNPSHSPTANPCPASRASGVGPFSLKPLRMKTKLNGK